MALHTIQTTMNPGVNIDVDDAEYERLRDLGLILNYVADPQPANHFDAEMASYVNDPTKLTHAAIAALSHATTLTDNGDGTLTIATS